MTHRDDWMELPGETQLATFIADAFTRATQHDRLNKQPASDDVGPDD